MAKQLLFYESAVPVSAARHADVSVDSGSDYAFTADTNAVPLMAIEFLRAATEYAIVFTPVGQQILPAVVLGVRGQQNLYLDGESHWRAQYVPAFVRRYPFVFSTAADRQTLTLCIDETHKGVNREGRGRRLFDEERKPSAYTGQLLKFMQDFQAHFQRTLLFCQKLKELDLLEPMGAEVTLPGKGEKLSLGGFLAVSRRKLRELKGEQFESLARTDELELIYLHLYSLRNFQGVKDKLVESLAHEQEPAGEPPAEERSAETPVH
jgi:hypothetical protein